MNDPRELPPEPLAHEPLPDWTEALHAAPRRRRPAGIVAVTLAVVAVLVGGVGAVVAMTGQETNTPDQAVRGLLTAVTNSDVLGVLDHVDPAERDAISGFLTNGTADLKRLGILSSGADLHHVSGLSVSFDGLTTSTTELRSGLDAVKITGGTIHTHVDPAQLPLGSYIHDNAGSSLSNAQPQDKTEPIHFDGSIVTVRRGDTWYVSAGYTAAEAARTAAKAALPRPQDAVPAVGADSATAAVDAFIRAAAALDVERLIELTPPDEMAALHEYAPLFLPKAADAITKLRIGGNGPTVTITKLDLTSESHTGGELVKVSQIGVNITFKGITVDLAPGAHCVTVSGTSTDGSTMTFPGVCGADGKPATGTSPSNPLSGDLGTLTGLHPDLGIVAVQRDGKWYVSPLRTGLDDVEAILHALTPDALKSLKNSFSASSVFQTLGGSSQDFSSSSSGSAIVPATPSSIPKPVMTPCVNGKRTVTFSTPPGSPTFPPMTVPCAG